MSLPDSERKTGWSSLVGWVPASLFTTLPSPTFAATMSADEAVGALLDDQVGLKLGTVRVLSPSSQV